MRFCLTAYFLFDGEQVAWWGQRELSAALNSIREDVNPVSDDFRVRTLVQCWLESFLAMRDFCPTADDAALALRAINALDHPNRHGERPYVDCAHRDLARRFVEKIEKAGLECPGLEKLKLRCGLMGRDPEIAKYE